MESNCPVLGICFGAQLLAAYLARRTDGRSLSRNPSQDHVGKLVGLAVRGKGVSDQVVEHLVDGTPVTQWHEDSFQVPPGAIGLAWSKDAKIDHCEAFRVGEPENAVYGLQFHPEPTLDMLLKGEKDEPWFQKIPALTELDRAVAAG